MASNLNIEKAAAEFRSQHGYSSLKPIRVESLFIDLNILTAFKNMEGSFSGMSLKIEGFKFMLINSAHSIGRQHFTIMHELYHLFIQEDFEKAICVEGLTDRKKEESLADSFAANLLLPRDGVLKLIKDDNELKKDKISINTILELEQYFSSSHRAMLNRLQQLNLISKEYAESFSENIKKYALEYGHDVSLYNPGNAGLIIGDYGAKAKRLYDREIISETHYIELMRNLGIDLEQEHNNSDES